MKRRHLLAGAAAISSLTLASCGRPTPSLPQSAFNSVDYVLIEKAKRSIKLFSQGKEVKRYKMHLGFNPIGHKQYEGDGRTPEGRYYITFKNPNSQFYLSVYINYPNDEDKASAAARGVSPGGDIFIHGGPRRPQDMNKKDWTAGCIAVTDEEVREIYNMVKIGATVDILP